IDSYAIAESFSTSQPAIEEVERRPETIVLVPCLPLLDEGRVVGAVVLVRDVTDLRRRDRMLLSKDAAIREVHHRVKNNLQTISSLLRLQGRRLDSPGARAALGEAERRIRSIALVHELLSRESGDHVPFDEIVHSLIRMAKESHTGDRPLLLRVDGDAGAVATDIATPLAVVLAELLQNAVEHAFAVETEAEEGPAKLDLVFRHDTEHLEVEVRDNGRGLPPGFDVDESASLGLAIVRDLVRTQLAGAIAFTSDKGTIVRLTVPLRHRAGRRA
ncbi:MAG TPA: sensor histidine kinase, partial [Acidimicrobiales bacterium]|nr:sensor histidine kinase [Acidimicrobiales bacterium]